MATSVIECRFPVLESQIFGSNFGFPSPYNTTDHAGNTGNTGDADSADSADRADRRSKRWIDVSRLMPPHVGTAGGSDRWNFDYPERPEGGVMSWLWPEIFRKISTWASSRSTVVAELIKSHKLEWMVFGGGTVIPVNARGPFVADNAKGDIDFPSREEYALAFEGCPMPVWVTPEREEEYYQGLIDAYTFVSKYPNVNHVRSKAGDAMIRLIRSERSRNGRVGCDWAFFFDSPNPTPTPSSLVFLSEPDLLAQLETYPRRLATPAERESFPKAYICPKSVEVAYRSNRILDDTKAGPDDTLLLSPFILEPRSTDSIWVATCNAAKIRRMDWLCPFPILFIDGWGKILPISRLH
jgi:hypothetical protein